MRLSGLKSNREIITSGAEATQAVGRDVGQMLLPGSVLCLRGNLGAGKTTFVKGLAASLCEVDPDLVSSPTYVYLNIYEGPRILYHFDLFRMRDPEHFIELGFEKYFELDGICCIEWSEKITPLLPKNALTISIHTVDEDTRCISMKDLF